MRWNAIATCPQRTVVLVEFGERHDTRTNGQHYTAADRRPTNQVLACSKLNGEVARHARHPRSILAGMSGVLARMSQAYNKETASV